MAGASRPSDGFRRVRDKAPTAEKAQCTRYVHEHFEVGGNAASCRLKPSDGRLAGVAVVFDAQILELALIVLAYVVDDKFILRHVVQTRNAATIV